MKPITCFKAYDIRGRVPEQLNTDVAYRIGRAFAQILSAKRVVVGHDIRQTSPELTDALVDGILDAGCDVMHIGQCGTEEVYFATFHHELDGGICVTASHNPMDYNGMKLVRSGSRPISGDSGLFDIQALAESEAFEPAGQRGVLTHIDNRATFVDHLLTYIDQASLASAQSKWLSRPLKVVVNAGNGGAGMVVDALEPHLPFEFIKVHHEPNGEFPNGIPNPLLPENRSATADAVIEHKADLGIAWDGDFDRCFFFDAKGRFLEGYYLVGLLAQAFLDKHSGAKIVHDPRLTWNTQAVVEASGGVPIQSKTGHAFIKERMRKEDAVYGGEMSAHHYFKEFAYCDSGMIPWLLVCELMLTQQQSLAQMVDDRVAAFPCSGEINRKVQDADAVLAAAKAQYAGEAVLVENVDGLSVAYADWRFNLRKSNTEPVIRLNVESRGDQALMEQKTSEILSLVDSH